MSSEAENIVNEEIQQDKKEEVKFQSVDFVLDIPLKVSVEVGRTSILVKDLLKLSQGSVIELDKTSGDPLEVLANGKIVAKGEIVVVNEKFGIRVTEILSPSERMESLK